MIRLFLFSNKLYNKYNLIEGRTIMDIDGLRNMMFVLKQNQRGI